MRDHDAAARPGDSTLALSIAVPLHDPNPVYLAESLASLRRQTLPPDEVVISDDSSRSSASLVAEVATGLPCRYVHQPNGGGMAANWNAAAALARGSHVVLLHQDDALEPRALEVMAGVFLRRPGLAVCGVGETRVGPDGHELCGITRPNHRERVFLTRREHELTHRELAYLMLRNGQVFGEPSAVMFARDRFEAIGGFDSRLRQSVDIDFVLRMTQAGGAMYVPDRLVRRRVHSAQATTANVAAGHSLRDRETLYRRHFDAARYDRREVERVRANLQVRALYDGIRAVRRHNWSVARDAVAQCLAFRTTARALAARTVELARWVNHDAR